MSIRWSSLHRIALFLAVLFVANKQDSLAQTQLAPVPARVIDAINPQNTIALHGNTHPLARAEFDRGAVADSQPLSRMLLLLQRSPQQDAALLQLLDDQQ